MEKVDKKYLKWIFEMRKTLILVANTKVTLRHCSTCTMTQFVVLTIIEKVFINMQLK